MAFPNAPAADVNHSCTWKLSLLPAPPSAELTASNGSCKMQLENVRAADSRTRLLFRDNRETERGSSSARITPSIEVMHSGWITPLETQIELELRSIGEMARSEDAREAIAAFNAKRTPQFRGV